MSTVASPPLAHLSTGSDALDWILGGGIPAHSVTIIAGEPGSGKTVLTLQMLFHNARRGQKALYFSTLSEPALKAIRYMQLFSFFDESLFGDRIVTADIGSTMRREGVERALEQVIERVEQDHPALVAIDSFKAIHDLFPDTARARAFVYDLAVNIAARGITTLLVGEYAPSEINTFPEFAIADGIIRLTNERQELTAVRALEVRKLRGAEYVTGQHFFEIAASGLVFYPRVQAPQPNGDGVPSMDDRVSTGVPGLDALLRGGLPRASATIVEGGTGTGKTLLGLSFLVHGARAGETGVLFTLEETPGQLRAIALTVGWDLAALEDQGRLVVSYTSPVELFADRFLHDVRQRIASLRARRVVIDSLTSASIGVPSERRFRELVYALSKHCRAAGATLLMIQEVPELLGRGQITGHGVSSSGDNLILLRYAEIAGGLERAIAVLKARGVRHATELRRLLIDGGGLRVGPRFTELGGVLTGVPQSTPAPAGRPAGRTIQRKRDR
jgi:circadian clock protein KaiC